MKTIRFFYLSIFSAFFALNVFSQARVQVIHNSADIAAQVVDVWLNETLLLDDFEFRTASPFIDAPSGVNIDISIQAPNSTDTVGAIARFTYNLVDGETYVLIANGIVSASGYTPNIPFDIDVFPMGREMASTTGNTDVLVYHGATDAPVVDIYESSVPAGTIVNDLGYSEFSSDYLSLTTADYVLDIQDETGTTTLLRYQAPLSTLGLDDSALVVLASGFLDPSANSNGSAFGLYVALPMGGDLIALPSIDLTARVQVIHNSADLAAEVVDVWLGDELLIDDFAFRTASSFIDAPAENPIDITIQPSNSVDTTNALAQFTYTLQAGETYVLVANGIVSASGYTPNIPFDIDVFPMGREMASTSGNTDVLVYHGATDAPVVDIYESSVPAGTIVNDLGYSEFSSDYLSLITADYVLDIQDETGSTTLLRYQAPLSTLGLDDSALVVLASGFLDPSVNSNGSAFGLYVALPMGGDLIALPQSSLGIETISNNESELLIYPTFARDMLHIEYKGIEEADLTIEIYNILGNKLLRTEDVSNGIYQKTLNIENLNSGLYYLVVHSNNQLVTKKFQVVR